ncbi:MAG: hypothetical protein QOH62_676 [Solirubrobacteraceae bacterium]|jgi:hypothetical protein|nr:hypothetical protein [Solirubrobacteraceae bacterium]
MSEHNPHRDEEALAELGRSLVQAAVAETHAPLALRERIEADRARARPALRRRRLALGGSLAGLVAAALLAVILASPASGPAGPSVVQAAELATLPATGPAPSVDPAHHGRLKRSVGGVSYPSWQYEFPWRASGVREDQLHGRHAVTVFYDSPAHVRIGYTIVAGKALGEPAGPVWRHGAERYVLLRRGSRTVVTWRRGGNTCVLSAPAGVPSERLLALASWSGAGTGLPS